MEVHDDGVISRSDFLQDLPDPHEWIVELSSDEHAGHDIDHQYPLPLLLDDHPSSSRHSVIRVGIVIRRSDLYGVGAIEIFPDIAQFCEDMVSSGKAIESEPFHVQDMPEARSVPAGEIL